MQLLSSFQVLQSSRHKSCVSLIPATEATSYRTEMPFVSYYLIIFLRIGFLNRIRHWEGFYWSIYRDQQSRGLKEKAFMHFSESYDLRGLKRFKVLDGVQRSSALVLSQKQYLEHSQQVCCPSQPRTSPFQHFYVGCYSFTAQNSKGFCTTSFYRFLLLLQNTPLRLSSTYYSVHAHGLLPAFVVFKSYNLSRAAQWKKVPTVACTGYQVHSSHFPPDQSRLRSLRDQVTASRLVREGQKPDLPIGWSP